MLREHPILSAKYILRDFCTFHALLVRTLETKSNFQTTAYAINQWFPTFIKAHTPKISQNVLAPLKYFNMSRAGAILKARLKLRVLTFFFVDQHRFGLN